METFRSSLNDYNWKTIVVRAFLFWYGNDDDVLIITPININNNKKFYKYFYNLHIKNNLFPLRHTPFNALPLLSLSQVISISI